MCSDQGIYQTRIGIAQLLGLPPEKIRVQYYPGSNTFGSSCYRDVAQAAAIMSQELGKPVRLQFSRQDEFGWDNYGPAHLADVRGAVNAQGKIVAFDYQAWGHDAGELSRRPTPPRNWRWGASRLSSIRRPAAVRSISYGCRKTTCTTFRTGGCSTTAPLASAI